MRSMSLIVDLIDLVTKHKSGELRCPATALIDNGFGLNIIYFQILHQENMSVKEIPLIPQFYIVKLGCAGVCLFFLFLFQNIHCGYLLEPPWQGSSNVYPQSMY